MKYGGFVGGSVNLRSPNANAERSINWLPVVNGAGTPKVRTEFYRTPGSFPFASLGPGPIRASFEEDGRAFQVSGAGFYELFANRTAILRGTVAVDANPATISTNGTGGNQMLVTSGGNGYLFSLKDNTFTLITDDAFPDPCLMALFFDGYFIALNSETGAFKLSDLFDGAVWNGLDFGLESQVSDRSRSMARTHDNLWLLGSKHASPWYNSGASSFPFQPVGGTVIEHGVEAPFSVAALDNTLFWLGRNTHGDGIVYRADGYTPRRISHDGLEYQLARMPRRDNAVAWTYMEEGHLFYVLYLPSAETTHVYDVTTDLWHERAIWNPVDMRWEPHLARTHCLAFGKHLVGDRASGTVYHMSLEYLSDYAIVSVADEAIQTTAWPVIAQWVVPFAPAFDSDVVLATPAVAQWVVPLASSSQDTVATVAVAEWVVPDATALLEGTVLATPAVAEWVVPAASTSEPATVSSTPASADWTIVGATASVS